MKPNHLRRLPWPSIVIAGAVLMSIAQAADLTHNAASTLTLSGAVSYDNVGIGSGSGSTSATIVNAEGTTSFTSNGTTFYVGAGPNGAIHTGTLKLGISNSITSNQITIGGLLLDGNDQNGHAGLVTTLANGTTTINTADMAIGTGKSSGTQIAGQTGGKFTLGSGATLNLYGLTGSNSRASLTLGRLNADGGRATGIMDLSAGTANLVLSQLLLGKTNSSSPLGSLTNNGTLTLSTSATNHLDISGTGNVVQIGSLNTGGNVPTTGTLTIGNLDSTSSIASTTDGATAILIASRPTTGTVTGTMNFNGGTLKITTVGANTAAIAGGGGTSNLNLSGGAKLIVGTSSTNWISGLSTAVIGTGGATIDTDGKTIGISQAFTGAGGLTKDGLGTLTLNGGNGYTGTTTVSNGTLALGAADRISNSSALSVTGGTFDLGGFTETVAAVSMSSGTISNGTLTGTSYAFTNSGTVSANLAGSGVNLTKSGSGTLTISSTTNSYSGTTNVSGTGTLVVDGNISTSSLTTIGTGSTLKGIGTVGALTISTGGFHNPGNSPGIMNTGNYIMNGTLTTEINGTTPGITGHDQVNVTGTVSLSGSLVAAFGGGSYVNGDMIFILLNDGADAVGGTFAGLAQGATVTNYGGYDWIISYTGNSGGSPTFTGGNDVVLMAVTAIPEPAAAILGSLGMVLLLRRRRGN